jgi:hypothetical protein
MKLTSDTLSGLFGDDAIPDPPEQKSRSKPVDESPVTPDAKPFRGGSESDESYAGITITKKDKDRIATMISETLTTAGLLVSLRCEECGMSIGASSDDIGAAAARYISGKPRMAMKMLEGGVETLDLLVLVSTVVPVVAGIAHHHLPIFNRERRVEKVDLMQPGVPWQQ